METVKTIKEAQSTVKLFAEQRGWQDEPNIDKFDHLHEELIAMSQHLRYKSKEEINQTISEKKELFVDGIGDLLFGLCRLANQLGVDVEEAFNSAKEKILAKYQKNQTVETNTVNPDNSIT